MEQEWWALSELGEVQVIVAIAPASSTHVEDIYLPPLQWVLFSGT